MRDAITDDWLAGKRVVVMGLGRFGGGVGVTRLLVRRGAKVLVTDQSSADDLAASVRELEDCDVSFRLGEHREADFVGADLVVVNPAVKPADNRYLEAARNAGVPLTSEMRLLAARLPDRRRVIGVTGSAGKSTVTAMIGEGLRNAGDSESRDGGDSASREGGDQKVATDGASSSSSPALGAPGLPACRTWIGGNIGGSLLDHVDEITPRDIVVLELSSFMLEGLRDDAWSPGVAVVTSFSPNHLDWHGDIASYRLAKQAVLDHQHAETDTAILGPTAIGAFEPRVRDVRLLDGATVAALAGELPGLLVPGEHNRLNALLAIEAATAALEREGRVGDAAGTRGPIDSREVKGEAHHALSDPRDLTSDARDARRVGECRAAIAEGIAAFPGLPHRLQLVAEREGVRYYNDSKCTTPEAAQLALVSFPPGVVHLIVGGYDKGADLSALASTARQRCRAIYMIGATGEAIAAAADRAAGDAAVIRAGALADALAATVSRVRRGDVVLLSPACASWDQFANFEHRGRAFVETVLAVTSEGAAPPAR